MRHNWAVGLTATFSVLDFPSLHFKKQIEQSNERAQRADYDKTIQTLTAQAERAKAAYDSAVLISQNTPVELEAARLGEQQATARYQAALAPIVEVAEAQRLLLQAETEDNLARLTLWQSMLGEALAQGDLQPFLERVQKARPLIAGYLSVAKASKKDNVISFIFSDNYSAEAVTDAREFLESLGKEVFGAPVTVAVQTESAPAATKEAPMREDPVLKAFQKHLGGEVVETRRSK